MKMHNWYISDKLTVDLRRYNAVQLLKKFDWSSTDNDYLEVEGGQLELHSSDNGLCIMNFTTYAEAEKVKKGIDAHLRETLHTPAPLRLAKAGM
jgi:hypothetical protein